MQKPKNKTAATPHDGKRTMDAVLAGFRMKGTSFQVFCEMNNLDKRNAVRAVKGEWTGKKAKAIRSKIIEASKAKALLKLQKANESTGGQ